MRTPGVFVTTTVRNGPVGTVRAQSGQFFIVGLFDRGPVNVPTKVRSMAEVERIFGSATNYSDAYTQLLTFFSEGGMQAYVLRVVGSASTAGTLSLNDRSVSSLPTLRIDAASVGAWSSGLSVEVSNGNATDSFRITVRQNGNTVEDYTNLSSVAEAVARFSKSTYVRLTNLGSVSTGVQALPALQAATNLSAGSDDRSSITAASYSAALGYFDVILGDGAVAIPGQNAPAVQAALVDHAEKNNRIALLAADRDATVDELKAAAAAGSSEYAGLFAPWVIVPDGYGATKTISPEGYVAAVRARAHEQTGPWRTPAGAMAAAQWVTGIDVNYSNDDFHNLHNSRVSIIKGDTFSVRLYGWNSLSLDEDNWRSLKDRDTVNMITTKATERLEKYVYETIDNKGILLAAIKADLIGLVDPIAKANGLFARYDEEGDEIDPGWAVSTDANTSANLSDSIINANLAVRVAPSGEMIALSIVKTGLLSAF